ncbi:hypothetical protein S40288_02646 [Stachybotrys chartarum IBT 40288]|nr:hypothetical protein S40288_02646 [Stachybotrys chartarum IBT 40288]
MASCFGRVYSGSPVLTMSPQPVPQSALPMAAFPRQHFSPSQFGAMSAHSMAASSRPSAGRKRSRDEAAPNLEADAPVPKPVASESEWTYGPGMVLIKKSGYTADASSQSGAWLEEKAALAEATRRQQEAAYVEPRNVKSQRVDRATEPSPLVSVAVATPLGQVDAQASPNTRAGGPVIDDFTLHLGIGWRRISADEHIQAAARGWARYIENHYPLTNVNICLESKGLQSYLVEASEGFFLFAENLRQGRLLALNVQAAMRNLQSNPPVFEGAETMMASESPRPTETVFFAPAVDAEMAMC